MHSRTAEDSLNGSSTSLKLLRRFSTGRRCIWARGYITGSAVGSKKVSTFTSWRQKAWSSPGRLGEYVSIVRARGKLLLLRTNGELVLVAAEPSEYKELGRTRVASSPTWAHLALARKRIYVKDRTQLACFKLTND